jgi:hypothetical protein
MGKQLTLKFHVGKQIHGNMRAVGQCTLHGVDQTGIQLDVSITSNRKIGRYPGADERCIGYDERLTTWFPGIGVSGLDIVRPEKSETQEKDEELFQR